MSGLLSGSGSSIYPEKLTNKGSKDTRHEKTYIQTVTALGLGDKINLY